MPQSYTLEFKKKIVRLHEEEGRTYKSITAEYGVSKAGISKWCREFSEECQAKALENSDVNIPVLISINPLADWHPYPAIFSLSFYIWIFLSQETQIPVTWKPVFRSGNHH